MGEMKRTPGPWTVRYRFGRLTTVNGRQRFPICDTGTAPRGEANDRREEANARLIAAAPDLLNLAKKNLETMAWQARRFAELGMSSSELDEAITQTRAALAKATDTQP